MKKLSAILSVMLVCAMLLTACGGGEVPATTKAPEAQETEAPVTAGNSDSEYAGMGTGKTLKYWSMWSETEAQAEVLKRSIARFEADTGYTVDVQWMGRDIPNLYPAAIDAGEVIDVYDVNGGAVNVKYAMDIDELAVKYGVKEYTLPAFDALNSGFTEDGHWHSMCSQASIGAIYYNKAIFREVGIETLPTTWDEFLDVCAKLKAAGYDPLTVDDAYVNLLYGQQLGLALGNEKANKLGEATGDAWADPQVLEVLKGFEEFQKAGYFSSTVGGNQFPAAQNGELAIGTAAMYFNFSWLPNEVSAITGDDFEWGVMYMPSITGGDYEIPQLIVMQSCVSPTTSDPEGAVLLLKYMTDVETNQDLADTAGCAPCVAGVEWPAKLADAKVMMDKASTFYEYGCIQPTNPDVIALANTYIHMLFGGACTAEEVVDHMVQGK